MAVPVHLWLKDDAGNLIKGSSDVDHREGSIELRGLTHNLSIPVDGTTGRLTGTRQHAPFLFEKEIDSHPPIFIELLQQGKLSNLQR